MMIRVVLFSLIPLLCPQVYSQTTVEGTFSSEKNLSGKYAMYLPSEFKKGKALPVIIAFHPLNTLKWNETSWRDKLIDFAEKNKVLLLCPQLNLSHSQGTHRYLDFVKLMTKELLDKYDAQPNCIYSIGAGMGANMALKFGIRHRNFINGLILVSSSSRMLPLRSSEFARCFNLPCYIIHGKGDQVQQKFYPLRKSLSEAGACIKSCLIDRFNPQIKEDYLSNAFNWVHNYSCNKPEYIWNENRQLQSMRDSRRPKVQVFGTQVKLSNIDPSFAVDRIKIYDTRGILLGIIRNPSVSEVINLNNFGDYTIMLQSRKRSHHYKVEIKSRN